MGKTGYLLTMSQKEIDRLQVLEKLVAKNVSQIDAARQLGISARQVRRLQGRYQLLGATGLLSARRGRTSQNKISENTKKRP